MSARLPAGTPSSSHPKVPLPPGLVASATMRHERRAVAQLAEHPGLHEGASGERDLAAERAVELRRVPARLVDLQAHLRRLEQQRRACRRGRAARPEGRAPRRACGRRRPRGRARRRARSPPGSRRRPGTWGSCASATTPSSPRRCTCIPHAPKVSVCATSVPSVVTRRLCWRVQSIHASADCSRGSLARSARTGASSAASLSSSGTVKGSHLDTRRVAPALRRLLREDTRRGSRRPPRRARSRGRARAAATMAPSVVSAVHAKPHVLLPSTRMPTPRDASAVACSGRPSLTRSRSPLSSTRRTSA